ncbi:MAG: DNA repair protein RadC [Spirochaetaceae bacterium]|jgi:DNA repair protein RadC|nr:DNA repair protein RadC [Spirochaetaceae bacterium]
MIEDFQATPVEAGKDREVKYLPGFGPAGFTGDAGDFQDLPKEYRPRERLCREGASALSDRELLCILLNTGIKGKAVDILADEVLNKLDRYKDIPPVNEMVKISGLGMAKAAAVTAMLELGRRHWGQPGTRISLPSDAYSLIRHYADRRQERFICISLNGAHEVLAVRVVTVGLVNKTIVHPREVFSDPLQDRASAVCVAHNHPSGRLEPSGEDNEITWRLRSAAEILGLRFLDHLIFSGWGFFSYSQAGLLRPAHT